METFNKQKGAPVVAVIVEPIQGEGGTLHVTADWLLQPGQFAELTLSHVLMSVMSVTSVK